MSDPTGVVAIVRSHGKILWYRSPIELWVLDYLKWRRDFEKLGYATPNPPNILRGGISIVNQTTKDKFLSFMKPYNLHKEELSLELAIRYQTADSWWDVKELFPIIFVDFDRESVGAFYVPGGTPLERYAPDSWSSEYIDFATEYTEDIFPQEDKFWIKGGSDLLKLLIEREPQGGN